MLRYSTSPCPTVLANVNVDRSRRDTLRVDLAEALLKLDAEFASKKTIEADKAGVEKQKLDLEYELRHAREKMDAEKLQTAEMAAVSGVCVPRARREGIYSLGWQLLFLSTL